MSAAFKSIKCFYIFIKKQNKNIVSYKIKEAIYINIGDISLYKIDPPPLCCVL
jgi:hypothetical protein